MDILKLILSGAVQLRLSRETEAGSGLGVMFESLAASPPSTFHQLCQWSPQVFLGTSGSQGWLQLEAIYKQRRCLQTVLWAGDMAQMPNMHKALDLQHCMNWVWWSMPGILVLRRRKLDCLSRHVWASLGYMRPASKKKKKRVCTLSLWPLHRGTSHVPGEIQ